MLKKVLIGLAATVVLAILGISTRPSAFHVERSVDVKAPTNHIYPLLVDFHAWTRWSPWEEKDPSMQRTYEGNPRGPGAIYTWAGTGQVGQGRMTIEEAQLAQGVKIKLEFLKPFAATNRGSFSFAPDAGTTKVTWAMDGDQTFGMKLAGLFMDMDTAVGKDFEAGLANLKREAEADAARAAEEAKKAAQATAAMAEAAVASPTPPPAPASPATN